MMVNDNILGPKRHLEDENRICEICALEPMIFFYGEKEQRSGR